jgi:thiamine biosynthesis protein ThiS
MPPNEQRSIIVNGAALATPSATLSDLLVEAGYADRKVATAVNGTFVPEPHRDRVSTTGRVKGTSHVGWRQRGDRRR